MGIAITLRHWNVALFLIGISALCAATWAVDQERYEPRLFQEMQWRNIGPYRGGRVTAVAGHPDQPFTYYFGATGGGASESPGTYAAAAPAAGFTRPATREIPGGG